FHGGSLTIGRPPVPVLTGERSAGAECFLRQRAEPGLNGSRFCFATLPRVLHRLEFPLQKCLRECPIALDRGRGNSQCFRSFIDTKSCKESQFDNARLPF